MKLEGFREKVFTQGFGHGGGEHQQRKILIIYHAHERHKTEGPSIMGTSLMRQLIVADHGH